MREIIIFYSKYCFNQTWKEKYKLIKYFKICSILSWFNYSTATSLESNIRHASTGHLYKLFWYLNSSGWHNIMLSNSVENIQYIGFYGWFLWKSCVYLIQSIICGRYKNFLVFRGRDIDKQIVNPKLFWFVSLYLNTKSSLNSINSTLTCIHVTWQTFLYTVRNLIMIMIMIKIKW